MDVTRQTRLEVNLPATRSALLACLGTIEDFGLAAKLGPDIVARVRLVVEELFSNTIKYGYGGECEREVRVSLSAVGGLTLVYEDDAPTFDPEPWRPADRRPFAAESPRVGEAGLALLFGLAASVGHQAADGGNRLVVTFAAPVPFLGAGG